MQISPTAIYKFTDPAGRSTYAVGAWVQGIRLPVAMEQAGKTIVMLSGHDMGVKESVDEVLRIFAAS